MSIERIKFKSSIYKIIGQKATLEIQGYLGGLSTEDLDCFVQLLEMGYSYEAIVNSKLKPCQIAAWGVFKRNESFFQKFEEKDFRIKERLNEAKYIEGESIYQALFNHMAEQHNLLLLESEMIEIVRLCKDILNS